MTVTRVISAAVAASLLSGCSEPKSVQVSETHHSVPVEAGRAPVPAGELYYELAGSGDAVVLIHGNAGDLRHWDAQFESLADEYQVLRYDLRGFGRSSAPVPGEAFSAFGDLAALLTFLDIPRAHIVGWSVGAGVAADFALAYPEMTRSMVQVAPWVNGYSSDAANQLGVEMSAVFRAGREGGTAEAVDAWVNAPFWMATVRDSAIGDRFRYIASAQSWMAPAAPLVRERLDPPAMDRLGDITQPVLLVTAEHDIPADVEVADLLEQTIPGARRVTMTGTGHMMHMERPDEFNSLLRDFLRSIER